MNKKIKLLHVIYRAFKTTESYPNHMIEGTYNNTSIDTSVYSMARPHNNDSTFNYDILPLPINGILSTTTLKIIFNLQFIFSYLITKKSDNNLWIKTNILNLFRFLCLAGHINKTGITHIHLHFGHHAIFFIELKKFLNVNTFISYYGVDTSKENLSTYSKVKKYCDCNLVLSEFMKKDLLDAGFKTEKIKILKIALKFSTMPLNLNIKERKKQILFAGRLVPKKRIIDAIDTFNLFNKNYPDYSMYVIGEGPEFEIAKERIKELNLEEKIILAGYQPPEATFKAMSESKVFLLPSKTAPSGDKEGTPVVIIESQLLGLPVVSTYHAGIPEIVKEGKTALLSEEGDINNLVKFISKLSFDDNYWNVFSNSGIEYVKENFEINRRVKELISFYLKF